MAVYKNLEFKITSKQHDSFYFAMRLKIHHDLRALKAKDN